MAADRDAEIQASPLVFADARYVRVALRLAHHVDPMAADLTLQWTYYLTERLRRLLPLMRGNRLHGQQEHTGCFCAVQPASFRQNFCKFRANGRNTGNISDASR